jgi:aerobic carbon-monoxide dehydrogenase medium subunit
MKSFEYCAPFNLSETFILLDKYDGQVKLLAGGTDLLIQMKNKEVSPHYVIDLKKIPELKGVHSHPGKGLRINPLTTISELSTSRTILENFPILAQAAKTIGSVQIRNRATVGGNLCRAAPSADLAPALLVLEARLKICNSRGERMVPLADFFVGPGQTVLQPGEILTSVEIPPPPPSAAAVYVKLGPRQAMDLATVGVAVLLAVEGLEAVCKSARIALGSVAPVPFRAEEAEKTIGGQKISPGLIEKAAQTASAEAKPITDVYGQAWYKKSMVAVWVRRALEEALSLLRKQQNEA